MADGFEMGKGRKVSLSAFIAHKIASAAALEEEQLDGLDEFEAYMKENGMAEFRPISEWEQWYDAYWTEIEAKEEAA